MKTNDILWYFLISFWSPGAGQIVNKRINSPFFLIIMLLHYIKSHFLLHYSANHFTEHNNLKRKTKQKTILVDP